MPAEQPTPDPKANVNVTLDKRTFPCPLCAAPLDVRRTFRDKPYCVCQSCGVQIFFRGTKGISRLRKLLDEHERLIGRPRRSIDIGRIAEMRAQGCSWRAISRELRVGVGTARNALARRSENPVEIGQTNP